MPDDLDDAMTEEQRERLRRFLVESDEDDGCPLCMMPEDQYLKLLDIMEDELSEVISEASTFWDGAMETSLLLIKRLLVEGALRLP